MRKGENPWDGKPSSSSCRRLEGRMEPPPPQNIGMGLFYRERKMPVPKSCLPSLARPPFGSGAAWGPLPCLAPRHPPGCSPSGASLGRAAGNSCRRAEI